MAELAYSTRRVTSPNAKVGPEKSSLAQPKTRKLSVD